MGGHKGPRVGRVHDYLYENSFIVNAARDYARASFKAGMASAQVTVRPVFAHMFSVSHRLPRLQVVYHANCRLPEHVDRSWAAYVRRRMAEGDAPAPDVTGKDRYKFGHSIKKPFPLAPVQPQLAPPASPAPAAPAAAAHRAAQTVYRESSAQTRPWQPAAAAAGGKPEVLFLDALDWGPGQPYRSGDLPADFHTTEIINKMRHARLWTALVEGGPRRGVASRDAVLADIETKDWIFRETEINEIQSIRLTLLKREEAVQRSQQLSRSRARLAGLWHGKKKEMDRQIEALRRTTNRELRKLAASHALGRAGHAAATRSARGGGRATPAAADRAGDVHAPRARHGLQARGRHAQLTYEAGLLMLEDHERAAAPPAWALQPGGAAPGAANARGAPGAAGAPCERETGWSEQFLKRLHEELIQARLGASRSAGPLHVLKPRHRLATPRGATPRDATPPRPATPEVSCVDDQDEERYQDAVLIQRLVRGRAVQALMYEGRTRAAELTEELKTTHGLQKEDALRIAREDSRARDHDAVRVAIDEKEDEISALVDGLSGEAVSSGLAFLEKELKRLREERRQHAFILVALRDKSMREAAEAGRRQSEERRRLEHDQMFKQILGLTQSTVDIYLEEVIAEGTALDAELQATAAARERADEYDAADAEDLSPTDECELVAQLVQHYLLPEAHRLAARAQLAAAQRAPTDLARRTIFHVLDERTDEDKIKCTRCGALGPECVCGPCAGDLMPVETPHRLDPRWKFTTEKYESKPSGYEDRVTPYGDFRCWLNDLLQDVVSVSRRRSAARVGAEAFVGRLVRERADAAIDARNMARQLVEAALGVLPRPLRSAEYRHYSRRVVGGALERDAPLKTPLPLLPSQLRALSERRARDGDIECRCQSPDEARSQAAAALKSITREDRAKMLPSELRVLEDMVRCKCDDIPKPSPAGSSDEDENSASEEYTDYEM